MKGLRVVALAAIWLPGPAAAQWNVARSSHFETWSDAGGSTARALASSLERLHTFFVRQLGIAPQGTVRVICFASIQEYAEYRIRPGADGFSLAGPDGKYIVTHASGGLRVPAHEYAHLLIHSTGWKLPEWLDEGISEVVSGVRFGERSSFIGGNLPGRSGPLKGARWMTPAELFSAAPQGQDEPARTPLFYSQSWALADMLIADPAYAPRFPAFLAMLARGSSSQAAIEGVFGVPAETLLRQARERLAHPLPAMPLPPVAESAAVRVEAASSFDTGIMLADLHRAAGHSGRAEAMYRELARDRPDAAEVPAALGLIALERRDAAAAVREWSRALALGLRDADLCYRYAVLADERGLGHAQVRAALERAIAIRPEFDDAQFRLGLMDKNAGRPAQALAHFRAMRPPPPERAWRYYNALADVLLDLNRRAEAKQAAGQAQRFAATDEERARARELAYYADTELSVEIVHTPDGRREFRTVRVPVNAAPRNPFIEAGEDAHSAQASLERIDCEDPGIRLIVRTSDGLLALSVPDPSRVQIRNGGGVKFEFTCGPQRPRPVLVEYTGANVLRGLELR